MLLFFHEKKSENEGNIVLFVDVDNIYTSIIFNDKNVYVIWNLYFENSTKQIEASIRCFSCKKEKRILLTQ